MLERRPPSALYLYLRHDGCWYWRVAAPGQALVARGYPVRAFPLQDVRSFEAAQTAECLILTRVSWLPDDWLGGIQWVRTIQASGRTVIYETDDDIFSEAWFAQAAVMTPDKPAALLEQERQYRIKALGLCDGVLVTTPRLATLVREYTAAPVIVVPNAIDWDGWRAVCARGRRPFTEPDTVLIGWAGGKRADGDFAPMATAWARIAARFPATRFVVVGYGAPAVRAAVPPERLAVAAWQPLDLYPMAYHGWDISCAPLEDKPFNAFKSPIKVFEAAAAGAAIVASPPVYGRVLRPGIDGLLATTADEWEAALARLVGDAGLRARLTAAWARRVQQRHTLATEALRWPAAWAHIRAQRSRALTALG
jgi:glycosyltransferase involved in cell wall biosynthesis